MRTKEQIRERRVKELASENPLILLHAVRRGLEDKLWNTVDESDVKATLPFVNAAIDSYIGFSLLEHRLESIASNGESITHTSRRI